MSEYMEQMAQNQIERGLSEREQLFEAIEKNYSKNLNDSKSLKFQALEYELEETKELLMRACELLDKYQRLSEIRQTTFKTKGFLRSPEIKKILKEVDNE